MKDATPHTLELETDKVKFLEEMAQTYGLPDIGKAVRCLINYAREHQDKADEIFGEGQMSGLFIRRLVSRGFATERPSGANDSALAPDRQAGDNARAWRSEFCGPRTDAAVDTAGGQTRSTKL